MIDDLLNAQRPRRRGVSTAIRTMEAAFVRAVWSRPPKPKGDTRLLNLGCGEVIVGGWINADFILPHQAIKGVQWPDWTVDVTQRWNCADGFFDGIFTEHLLEHLTYPEALFALREAHRTLKPGGRLRIVVPDIAKYVAFYSGEASDETFASRFANGAVALSNVTQCFDHVSVWDAPTMISATAEIGFVDVTEVSRGVSSDERLLIDTTERAWESFYVEARKPETAGASPSP